MGETRPIKMGLDLENQTEICGIELQFYIENKYPKFNRIRNDLI